MIKDVGLDERIKTIEKLIFFIVFGYASFKHLVNQNNFTLILILMIFIYSSAYIVAFNFVKLTFVVVEDVRTDFGYIISQINKKMILENIKSKYVCWG